MERELESFIREYRDVCERWRAVLLDMHVNYHGGSFDDCAKHRCYEYRWTLERHGPLPTEKRTRG